jgi:hypothetical protein
MQAAPLTTQTRYVTKKRQDRIGVRLARQWTLRWIVGAGKYCIYKDIACHSASDPLLYLSPGECVLSSIGVAQEQVAVAALTQPRSC